MGLICVIKINYIEGFDDNYKLALAPRLTIKIQVLECVPVFQTLVGGPRSFETGRDQEESQEAKHGRF